MKERDILEEVKVFSEVIQRLNGAANDCKCALSPINRFDESFLEDRELLEIQKELYKASVIIKPLTGRLEKVILKSLGEYEAP